MQAVLLLGTNLDDRLKNLNQAQAFILERIGELQLESSVYRTAPWGNREQDDFLNKIIVVQTFLKPHNLLDALLDIEKEMGRVRSEKWAPRLIDLDIIYYNNSVIHENDLTIPHPYIQDRRFTLVPLVEIMPFFVHPGLHQTNAELLAQTSDLSEVFLLENGKG
ncbi:MAG: 2-amino-4-hydroxy-6-hydroxymethyldihydropteridine diphosphokinase [Bacteroidetes bacterium]|nr:2-amino-4-hydroxy-6-hydroxymethyldihydropteridine diphosphokinase [Bacteroidota bacterium]